MPDPYPIQGLGYSQVYTATGLDIFNNIGVNNVWANRDFWQGAPPAGAHTVSGTTLNLISKRTDGYPNITVSSLNLTTKANSLAFRRGYFEAQIRWTQGAGSWPGFWLLSKAHAQGLTNSGLLVSEFDIFEGQGTTPYEMSGALHRNTSSNFGVADTFRGCWTKPTAQPILTTTHRFAGLWTATTVSWYIDDEFLCSQPVYDSTNQDMYLLFSMWIGGWAANNCIDCAGTTPNSLTLQVDYVSVWQQTTTPTGAPVNATQPSFSGTPVDGNLLTGSTGSWTGAAVITYAYQWQRCTSGTCVDIGAATSSTYTLTSSDIGSTIRLKITATNGSGSTIAYSAQSSVVGGQTGVASPPVNLTLPVILGMPRVGRTLSATTGTWTATGPVTYAYQWERCDPQGASCVDIGGATSSTYVPTTLDVTSTLRVRVTASN